MTELKPCPFCGGAGKYHDSFFEDDVCEYVSCTRCNASTPLMYKKGESIEWWNRKASPWHKGTPTEDGDYLCVFDDCGYPLYGWCVYRYGKWGYLSGYDPNVYHMVAWQRIDPYKEKEDGRLNK